MTYFSPCFIILLFITRVTVAYSLVPYFATKATECSEIDLRKNAPPDLKSFFSTINTQGDLNWCYAYSAADLLSWEAETPISATYSAIKSNNNLNIFSKLFRNIGKHFFGMNKIIPEFGDTASAIKLGLKNGVCPDKIMPAKNPNIQKIDKEISLINQRYLDKPDDSITCDEHRRLFPTKEVAELIPIIGEIQYKTVQEKLNKIADSVCDKNLIKPNGYRKINSFNASDIDVVNSVNDHFTSEPASPISLTISIGAIDNPHSTNGSLMAHAVTILGRKFDPESNKCTYLIRDSNGQAACKDYAKNNKCKDGYYWITDESIHRGAWNITYITK